MEAALLEALRSAVSKLEFRRSPSGLYLPGANALAEALAQIRSQRGEHGGPVERAPNRMLRRQLMFGRVLEKPKTRLDRRCRRNRLARRRAANKRARQARRANR